MLDTRAERVLRTARRVVPKSSRVLQHHHARSPVRSSPAPSLPRHQWQNSIRYILRPRLRHPPDRRSHLTAADPRIIVLTHRINRGLGETSAICSRRRPTRSALRHWLPGAVIARAASTWSCPSHPGRGSKSCKLFPPSRRSRPCCIILNSRLDERSLRPDWTHGNRTMMFLSRSESVTTVSAPIRIQGTAILAVTAVLGVAALALLLRVALDQSGEHLTTVYLDSAYHGLMSRLIAEKPFWYFLLPMPDIKGVWATTSFVPLYFLETTIGPNGTFLIASTAAILAFGWFCWVISGSPVMTLVGSAALAFSPFNYSVYLWNGSNNVYCT